MRFIPRNVFSPVIAAVLVAGVAGLSTAAVAADSSTSSQSSNSMPGSRMAPTQNTTGSGSNPNANQSRSSMDNSMSGNSMSGNSMTGSDDKLQPMDGSSSQSTRMAPTQNTTGAGHNPDAND